MTTPTAPGELDEPDQAGLLDGTGRIRPIDGIDANGENRPTDGIDANGENRPTDGIDANGEIRPPDGIDANGEIRPADGIGGAGKVRPADGTGGITRIGRAGGPAWMYALAGWLLAVTQLDGDPHGASEAEIRRRLPIGALGELDGDPDTMTVRGLRRLPAIGPARALAIARARWEDGLTGGPESWDAIRGIGPETVAAIRRHLDEASGPGASRTGASGLGASGAEASRRGAGGTDAKGPAAQGMADPRLPGTEPAAESRTRF